MVSRDDALDAESGVILDEEFGGAHLSSGSIDPIHSGLKGDWYFKTTDQSRWYLPADGTGWIKELVEDQTVGGASANYIFLSSECVGGNGA